MFDAERDERYLNIVLKRIEVCKLYKPKFGQGHSISLDEFEAMYGSDPFYAWFGLNNHLMYAAHKAAGGITSLYRQIGIGCEKLFRQIIQDQLSLSASQASWSYNIQSAGRRDRKLSLDARIQLDDLTLESQKYGIQQWLAKSAVEMNIDANIARVLKGAVFEVRQGYKSKDSKRQNADISNAGTAYTQGYLPVVVVLSTQIDNDVADRYRHAGWLLLRGYLGASSTSSTFAFCSQVLEYDLAGFFERYSRRLHETVETVLKTLLSPNDTQFQDVTDVELLSELELRDELEGRDED